MAGVTEKVIQSAEAGGPVSPQTLKAICAALGLPLLSVVLEDPGVIRERLAAMGRSPPPPPVGFVGREVERRIVAAALAGEEARPVCVAGASGIGKSALALQIARDVGESFPGGVAWFSATYVSLPLEVRSVFEELSTLFGFQTRIPPAASTDAETLARAFHYHFARERRLLIFDDVRSEEVARLLAPPGAPVRVLITTCFRHLAAPYAGRSVEVPGLEEPVACRLLVDEGFEGSPEDAAGLARLARVLGGVPRALIAARRVLARERFTPPGALADRLAARPDPAERVPPDRAVERVLEEARAPLSGSASTILVDLALLGTRPFPVRMVAKLAAIDDNEAARALGELADAHLVAAVPTPPAAASVGPMAVLEPHAEALAPRHTADQIAAGAERLCQWVLDLVTRPEYAAPPHLWALFGALRPMFVRCLELLADGHDGHPSAMLPSLLLHLEPLIGAYRVADVCRWLDAARVAVTREPDRRRVLLLTGIARALGDGSFAEGAPLIAEAAADPRSGDALVDASARCALSRMLIAQNDNEGARACFTESLELAREAGLAAATVGAVLNDLAIVTCRVPAGDPGWGRSVALFEEAAEELSKAPYCGTEGALVALSNAGLAGWVAGVPHLASLDHGLSRLLAASGGGVVLTAWLEAHAAALGLALDAPGPRALADRAAERWRGALLESPPPHLAVQMAWTYGEAASYLARWRTSSRDAASWLAAGTSVHCYGLRTPEVVLCSQRGMEVGLLLLVSALQPILDEATVATMQRFVDDVLGPFHVCSGSVRMLASILGRPTQ